MRLHIINIQKFFVFLLIFFSSAASVLATNDLLLAATLLVLISIHLLIGFTKSFLREFLTLFFFIVSLILLYFWINSKSEIYTWLGLGAKIIFAFLVLRLNKDQFVINFLKVMQFLCIVALLGYFIQLLAPNFLFSAGSIFDIGLKDGFKKTASFLIFNFSFQHSLRNSGCMWEPGAFGAMLILCLLFSNNPQFGYPKKKMSLIFVLALITTFSTATYLICGIILVYIFMANAKNLLYKIFNLFLLLPFLLIVFINTEFLSDKIDHQIKNVDVELYKSQKYDQMHTGRFTSVVMDYPVFIQRPWLGYGIDLKLINASILYKEYDEDVVRTYGGTTMLLYFGIIGFLTYFTLIYIQFYKISNSVSYALFSILAVLLFLFSNPLPFSPIILSLFFLYNKSDSSLQDSNYIAI